VISAGLVYPGQKTVRSEDDSDGKLS